MLKPNGYKQLFFSFLGFKTIMKRPVWKKKQKHNKGVV